MVATTKVVATRAATREGSLKDKNAYPCLKCENRGTSERVPLFFDHELHEL